MQQTDPVNGANIPAAQGSRFFNLVQEANTTVKDTSKSLGLNVWGAGHNEKGSTAMLM